MELKNFENIQEKARKHVVYNFHPWFDTLFKTIPYQAIYSNLKNRAFMKTNKYLLL